MSDLEINNQNNNSLENTIPQQQNVEVEASGQLRIIFDDEKKEIKDDKWEKKESKKPFQGVVIHIDREDEEEWENPDYTGDYTDFYRK